MSTPFVGRQAPLRTLLGAVEAAAAGHGMMALVAGEPGIGKTRLVTELAGRVSAPVLWATCWEGEGTPAYWPWLQLLRALDPGRSGPSPTTLLEPADDRPSPGRDAAQLESAEARFRLFETVAGAFRDAGAAVGDGRALVLVIDDLHWADEPSILLLRFLAHDLRTSRVAVIGTYRDSDLDETHPLARALGDLARAGSHLSLRGLDEAEVGALVDALSQDPAGVHGTVSLLHRQTGGNPFFVRETLRLLETEGQPPGAVLGAGMVPGGVGAVVAQRLDRRSVECRNALTAAAVLGVVFDVATLGQMLGRDPLGPLDEAVTARLAEPVDEHGRRFTFAHALVRQALIDSLRPRQRVELHRSAAAAIGAARDPDRIPELAHHLLAGAGSDNVDVALASAASAARRSYDRLAYEDAGSWYERALDVVRVWRAGTTQECDLLVWLGEARHACGDRPRARQAFEQAALLARELGDHERLAQAALGVGADLGGFEVQLLDPPQVDLLEEALRAIGPEPSSTRAWLLARLAVALSFLESDARRRELSEDAVATARLVGDQRALGYALAAQCDAMPGPDACEARIERAEEAVAIGRAVGDRRLELLGRRLCVIARLETGDVGGADHHIDAFALIAEQLRQPVYRWYVPLWRGMRALMRGDVDEADRLCAEAERLGAAAHSHNSVIDSFTLWWLCRRADGHAALAGQQMQELMRNHVGAPQLGADRWAVAAVMAGDHDQGRRLLEEWLASGLHRRQQDAEWLPESAQVAEAAIVVDCRPVADAVYDQLRPFAHRFCVEGDAAAFTGSVSWYLAMLARYLGNDEAGESYREQARRAHRRVGLVGDPPPLAGTPAAAGAAAGEGGPERTAPGDDDEAPPWLRAEGATWALSYRGRTARVRDTKGVRDLAILLAQPGREVHCLELMGGADTGEAAGPGLDDQARRAYERRIRDLQEDIDDARAANDLARAERAEAELDALVQQLAEAFGLGARQRRTGSAAERARAAVTHRLRAAIGRIGDVHPELGRHLDHSVRTGTWCAYQPETAVTWAVETGGRGAP